MNELAVFKDYTPDQLQLIKTTVAKNATNDELGLFLYRCKLLELNPLKPGQIHFVKYGTGAPTIVIGIEGFRSIAARTGKLSGIKRGAIKDEKGVLIGAWAEVYRNDWNQCAREEVPLKEYDKGNSTWKNMPETMIKKVAEAAALRMAFPDNLGGVYEQAEMDQAQQEQSKTVTSIAMPKHNYIPAKVTPVVTIEAVHKEVDAGISAAFQQASEQSTINSDFDQTNFEPTLPLSVPAAGTFGENPQYVCKVGKKYIGMPLEQIGLDNVKSYGEYLGKNSKKDNKQLSGDWADFYFEGERYLNANGMKYDL